MMGLAPLFFNNSTLAAKNVVVQQLVDSNPTLGSTSESCQPTLWQPCNLDCESVLQNLYIDLFNLIVESRVPGLNERGYGDGSHCPPLLGPNLHSCDLLKPECQKHERLIRHLLKATRNYVFEIEVLMLPDCCSDLKLLERIQDKEYILLERWSMKCNHSSTQPTIEKSELLRAVRSFLHFSQLSAWLSLTKGKSPSNIFYWVKPTVDASPSQFECNPEVHSFPVCKISDELCGIIKVKYPKRTQFIPVIPCSKHPLHPITFRTIADDPSLSESIALTPSIVKQFQKSCDNKDANLSSKCCSSDSEALLITPTSVIKTLRHNRPVENNAKRAKLLSSPKSSPSSQDITSNFMCHFQISKIDEICSKATLSKYTSHDNLCFSDEKLSCLSGEESKLTFNKDVCSVLNSPKKNTSCQQIFKNIAKSCAASSVGLDPQSCSNSNTLCLQIDNVKSSHIVSNTLHCKNVLCSQPKQQLNPKLNKRKETASATEPNIPNKRRVIKFDNNDELVSSEFIETTSLHSKNKSKIRKKLRKHNSALRTSKYSFKKNPEINDVLVSNVKELENRKFCQTTRFESSISNKVVSTKTSSNASNDSETLLNDKGKFVTNKYSTLCQEQSASVSKFECPDLLHNVLDQKTNPLNDLFQRHKLKGFRRRKLLGNFEESLLKGCFIPVNVVDGFHAEIGASGSFHPSHITLPAKVTFYELDSSYSGVVPYMAYVTLPDEYYLPKKGAVQVTLFNPSETVVKMFVVNYDLSNMPPMCHTFMRQKTYYMPIGSTEKSPSQKWLRFIIHLRFASSKTGKIYLYKDFKIVVLNRSNDDAASEFSQEPCELRSFLHVPANPAFSYL